MERAVSKKMTCMMLVNLGNDEAINVNIKFKRKSFMDLATEYLYSAYVRYEVIWKTK